MVTEPVPLLSDFKPFTFSSKPRQERHFLGSKTDNTVFQTLNSETSSLAFTFILTIYFSSVISQSCQY